MDLKDLGNNKEEDFAQLALNMCNDINDLYNTSIIIIFGKIIIIVNNK